jgi:hypothetical protein
MKKKDKPAEREAELITIHYDDGTTEELKKGFIAFMSEPKDEQITFEFKFVHIAGREIVGIVNAVMQLGKQLGMFDRRTAQ